MKADGKNFFGGWEIGCLVINILTYRFFTNLTVMFPRISGTAAALTAVYSGIAAILLIWVICTLIERCGKKNFIDLSGMVFGKAGRFIAAVLLVLYMIISAVYSVREFSRFAEQVAFPTAPLWFLLLFFAAAMYIGAVRGLAAIVRTHVLVIPIIVILVLILIISVLWNADFTNLLPFLGNGTGNLLGNGLTGLMMYSDIILLFLINPFCVSPRKFRQSAMVGAVISVIINSALVLAFTAAIPYPSTTEIQYPLYVLLKEVNYGRFLQRVDAIYMLVTELGGMLWLSYVLFAMTYTVKFTFKTTDNRMLAFPFVLVIFVLAAGVTVLSEKILGSWLLGGSLASLVVLLLIALAAGGRNMREKN